MTDSELCETALFRMKQALVDSKRMSTLCSEAIAGFETQSEKQSYRSALIIEAATTLFSGDNFKAVTWCLTPAQFLSGSEPLTMTGNDEEVSVVLDSIGKLQHGIPL